MGRLPLLFEPGTELNYSVATDVLGRLVEVLSGQTLDALLQGAHLRPARHDRHRFSAVDQDRLAALYEPGLGCATTAWARARCATPDVPLRRRRAGLHAPPTTTASRRCSSRGELTAAARTPYAPLHGPQPPAGWRRARGVRAGRRSPRPQNDGMGFGLGFSVVEDPAADEVAASAGRVRLGRRWPAPRSGSTRAERISVQFFTQMLPSSTYPLRSQLRQLVYQALVD